MTLDNLAKELNLWRKSKKSTQQRIPQQFWKQALILAEQTSPALVASKLKIDRGRIIKKMSNIDIEKNKKIDTTSNSKKKSQISFKKIKPIIPQNIPVFEITTSAGTIVRIFQ
jgi:hypothetical protein